MLVTKDYVFFWGSELSNFWQCPIKFMDADFSSSEQIFMFCKATHFNDENIAYLILNAPTPKQAKALGRQVSPYNNEEWDRVREHYMTDAVWAKFDQNPNLKEFILQDKFKGKTFVEASPYDRIWGIGMGENHPDLLNTSKWGRNLLGKILTKYRDEHLKV